MGGSCDDRCIESAGAAETAVEEPTGDLVGSCVGEADTVGDEDTVGKLVGEGVGALVGRSVGQTIPSKAMQSCGFNASPFCMSFKFSGVLICMSPHGTSGGGSSVIVLPSTKMLSKIPFV